MFKFVSRDATRDVCGGVELGQLHVCLIFAHLSRFLLYFCSERVITPNGNLPAAIAIRWYLSATFDRQYSLSITFNSRLSFYLI